MLSAAPVFARDEVNVTHGVDHGAANRSATHAEVDPRRRSVSACQGRLGVRQPRTARGYYREYTVATPGVRHRGARRIVCGGDKPTVPEACYYSADHYASFLLIAQ
jgi:hypothetical protein